MLSRALPTPPVSRHIIEELDPTDDTYEIVAVDDEDEQQEQLTTHIKRKSGGLSDYLEPVSHRQCHKPTSNKSSFMYVSAHTTQTNSATPLTQIDGFHQMAALQQGTLHQLMCVLIGEYSRQDKLFGPTVRSSEVSVPSPDKVLHAHNKVAIYTAMYNKHLPTHCTIMVSCSTEITQ